MFASSASEEKDNYYTQLLEGGTIEKSEINGMSGQNALHTDQQDIMDEIKYKSPMHFFASKEIQFQNRSVIDCLKNPSIPAYSFI